MLNIQVNHVQAKRGVALGALFFEVMLLSVMDTRYVYMPGEPLCNISLLTAAVFGNFLFPNHINLALLSKIN